MSGSASAPEAETIIRQTEQINRTINESTGRIQRLEAQLDRTAAAQQRYEAAQRTINSALERGRVSQERANQLLDLAGQKYQQATASANQLAAANDNVTSALGGLAARAGPVGSVLSRFGAAGVAAAAAIGGLTLTLSGAIREAEKFERLSMRTEAVVRATGGTAGLTAQEIRALSQEIARTTLASTEGVEQAAQQLLTFRNVSGDAFGRTLRAAQDLAAVGFGSIQSAALQLGKALENPAEGLAALTRVGVTFNAEQRRMIENFMEAGQVAEAQRVILESVERQVGGAGRAEAGGLAGAYDTLAQNVQEFMTKIGNTGPIQAATVAVNTLAAAVRMLDEAIFRTSRYTPQAITGRLSALRTELSDLEGQIDGAAPQRGGGTGPSRLQLDQASARAAFVRQEIARIVAEQSRGEAQRAEVAAAGAAERDRMERDAAASAVDQLRQSTNRRLQIERTFQREMATLRRGERAGVLTGDALQAEIRAAEQRREQALSGLDRPARGGGRGGRDTSEADRRKEEADARRLEQDAQRFLAANVPAERYRQQLQEIEDLNQRLIAAGRNPLPEAAVLAAQASALEQYNNAMRNTDEATRRAEQSSKELRQAMESVAREMTRAFEDLVFEGKSFNDVLKDLERSLLRLGNKYLLEPLFQSAMSGLFGGMGGGAGNGTFGAGGYTGKGPFLPSGGGMGGGVAGWIGSAVQLIGSLFHDGGIVGSSRVPTRAVPAAAFYDAPRYHSGGFAGRMPFANDELPAVLKRGELVLTQEQQRAVAGNGRPINQTVIVQTSDPGQFSRTKDQMAREMRRDLARASRSA